MTPAELHQHGPDTIISFDGGISFVFSRVHESREDIAGMLRIALAGFPGRPDGDIYDNRVVITGPTSQSTIAKFCASRVGEVEDWPGLVAQACRMVRKSLEEGTPIVNLAELDAEPEAPWALDPLFRDGESVLLYGAAATAKSTIALAIAAAMTTGAPTWGWTPAGSSRVLYVDYEDEAQSLTRRLQMLSAGLGLPSRPAVLYKHAEASLPVLEAPLARQIADQRIEGLIVDSAALACGAEPEAADSANAYFRTIRRLHLRWSVTIAHQPKARERDPLPFGSQFWFSNPRTIWRTQLAREDGKAGLAVGLWNRKANNADLHPPLAYQVRFTPGVTTTITPIAPRGVVDFVSHLSNRERVMAALEVANLPLDYRALEDRTGLTNEQLRVTIHRLSALVEKTENGFRILPQAGIQ